MPGLGRRAPITRILLLRGPFAQPPDAALSFDREEQPMKQVLLMMLCLGIGVGLYAAEECVKKEKDYYGSKYFNKCYCETLSYPDVAEAMDTLGISAKPRWVACSTFGGNEWCVCGVHLSWKERPEDSKECEAKRNEVGKLIQEFLDKKKDFGVSAPLICP
jgi:hypothetical protein